MVESHTPTCPMCGGALAAAARECPLCGEPQPGTARSIPGNESSREPKLRPARPHDYVLLGLVSIVACAITVPPTWTVMGDALPRTPHPAQAYLLMVVVMWNSWVWGGPMLFALFSWQEGVQSQAEDYTYLVRVFWQCQAITVGLPLSLFLLVLAICALG